MQQPLITDPAAEEAALLAGDLLATRGWLLWRYEHLDGDTVALVRGLGVELPAWVKSRVHAIYTEDELRWIDQHNTGTARVRMKRRRTWHNMKKAAHACGQRLVIAEIKEATNERLD